MRIALLFLITAAVLGGLVGTLMLRDPGYVLVSYAGRALETSLWFALVLLFIAYFVIRIIVFLTARLLRGRSLLGTWRKERGQRSADKQTVRGLLLLAEGQWDEARRMLTEAGQSATMPLVNYLQAAQAAHESGDAQGRDELLDRADATTPGARAAVLLTRARLLFDEGLWRDCRAALLEVREMTPRHPFMLGMLGQCHERLGDWQAVIELLPDLHRSRAVDGETLQVLERRAWSQRLNGGDFAETWQNLPKELRRDPELVAARAQRLVDSGEPAAAERAVRKALDRNWDERLIDLYGRIPTPDSPRQMAAAEGWLADRPNDASLLLALGRIAMMNGAWSKAREYLEASLRIESSTAVYGELGRLLNHLGEFIRGSEYLGKACIELPNLPLPPRPGH